MEVYTVFVEISMSPRSLPGRDSSAAPDPSEELAPPTTGPSTLTITIYANVSEVESTPPEETVSTQEYFSVETKTPL